MLQVLEGQHYSHVQDGTFQIWRWSWIMPN